MKDIRQIKVFISAEQADEIKRVAKTEMGMQLQSFYRLALNEGSNLLLKRYQKFLKDEQK